MDILADQGLPFAPMCGQQPGRVVSVAISAQALLAQTLDPSSKLLCAHYLASCRLVAMAGTWMAMACLLSLCISHHALADQEPGDMACIWDVAIGCSVDPQWFEAVWPASAAGALGEYRSQLAPCTRHSSKSDCLTADCAWFPG